jgi:hypothetical protein
VLRFVTEFRTAMKLFIGFHNVQEILKYLVIVKNQIKLVAVVMAPKFNIIMLFLNQINPFYYNY